MRLRTLAPLAAVLFACAGSAFAVTPGDINGDGKVGVGDAILALQFSVEIGTPTSDQILAGDVSPVSNGVYGDKKIDVKDSIRILQYTVGLIPAADFPGGTSVNEQSPTLGVPLPTFQAVTISGDVPLNFQLPSGFKLQGKVLGTKPKEVTSEEIAVLDDKGQLVVTSPISASGDYAVGVPAGTYQIYYQPQITTGSDFPGIPGFPERVGKGGARPQQIPGLGATTTLLVATGTVLQVNADTTKDITRPALPALFTVSGTINATLAGGQPPFNFRIRQIKDAAGNDVVGQPAATASLFAFDENYSISLPAGVYTPEVTLTNEDGSAVFLQAEPQITVAGPTQQQISLPSLAVLSGSATLSGQPFGDVNPTVSATPTTPASPQAAGSFATLSFAQIKQSQYALRVTPGTYDLAVGFEEDAMSASSGRWNFSVTGVDVQADKTENLLVPQLISVRATVQGKVRAPGGAPVTKGDVFFVSQTLQGGAPRLGFSISSSITTTGDYSVKLPPGDYRAFITPDVGFPLATPFDTGGVVPVAP